MKKKNFSNRFTLKFIPKCLKTSEANNFATKIARKIYLFYC